MKSYFFTIPKGSVYFEVFTSWPRGCVAAIKILVYFTSWQHGRMALQPLKNPFNPLITLFCGYAATLPRLK